MIRSFKILLFILFFLSIFSSGYLIASQEQESEKVWLVEKKIYLSRPPLGATFIFFSKAERKLYVKKAFYTPLRVAKENSSGSFYLFSTFLKDSELSSYQGKIFYSLYIKEPYYLSDKEELNRAYSILAEDVIRKLREEVKGLMAVKSSNAKFFFKKDNKAAEGILSLKRALELEEKEKRNLLKEKKLLEEKLSYALKAVPIFYLKRAGQLKSIVNEMIPIVAKAESSEDERREKLLAETRKKLELIAQTASFSEDILLDKLKRLREERKYLEKALGTSAESLLRGEPL